MQGDITQGKIIQCRHVRLGINEKAHKAIKELSNARQVKKVLQLRHDRKSGKAIN